MPDLAPISGQDLDTLRIMPTSSILEYFLSNETPGTATNYSGTIRGFFAWCPKDFREVTPFDALAWNDYLQEHFKPATVQNRVSAVNRFFRFAKECGIIDKNPFAVVKQRAVRNFQPNKFLTAKELSRLLDALKSAGKREYVMGLLLASTGMRISELHGLSWCDFIESQDGGILINVLRKGGEHQLLPLRNDVWEVVHEYMGNRPLSQFDQSPLFLNHSQERVSTQSMRKWVREAAKRAKISKVVTPHVFRHSFCSLSLAAGASLRDVQEAAGHSSALTTQKYLHPTNQNVGAFVPLNLNDETR